MGIIKITDDDLMEMNFKRKQYEQKVKKYGTDFDRILKIAENSAGITATPSKTSKGYAIELVGGVREGKVLFNSNKMLVKIEYKS